MNIRILCFFFAIGAVAAYGNGREMMEAEIIECAGDESCVAAVQKCFGSKLSKDIEAMFEEFKEFITYVETCLADNGVEATELTEAIANMPERPPPKRDGGRRGGGRQGRRGGPKGDIKKLINTTFEGIEDAAVKTAVQCCIGEKKGLVTDGAFDVTALKEKLATKIEEGEVLTAFQDAVEGCVATADACDCMALEGCIMDKCIEKFKGNKKSLVTHESLKHG